MNPYLKTPPKIVGEKKENEEKKACELLEWWDFNRSLHDIGALLFCCLRTTKFTIYLFLFFNYILYSDVIFFMPFIHLHVSILVRIRWRKLTRQTIFLNNEKKNQKNHLSDIFSWKLPIRTFCCCRRWRSWLECIFRKRKLSLKTISIQSVIKVDQLYYQNTLTCWYKLVKKLFWLKSNFNW